MTKPNSRDELINELKKNLIQYVTNNQLQNIADFIIADRKRILQQEPKQKNIPCQGEWHTLSYDEYAKKHGGMYPRSCPECHSCFNPNKEEPKQELDEKEVAKIIDNNAYYTTGERDYVIAIDHARELSKAICSKFGQPKQVSKEDIANRIRIVDGNHDKSAGEIAEAIHKLIYGEDEK